jgi:hypothetical protein
MWLSPDPVPRDLLRPHGGRGGVGCSEDEEVFRGMLVRDTSLRVLRSLLLCTVALSLRFSSSLPRSLAILV